MQVTVKCFNSEPSSSKVSIVVALDTDQKVHVLYICLGACLMQVSKHRMGVPVIVAESRLGNMQAKPDL